MPDHHQIFGFKVTPLEETGSSYATQPEIVAPKDQTSVTTSCTASPD